MRSRILFVSHTADWIGPTHSLFLLLEKLRERYEVSVLLPGQGTFSARLAEQGIPFFSLKELGIRSVPIVYGLIEKNRIDLVYANTKDGSSRNAFLASKLARVPFICHVREMGWGKPRQQMFFLRLADAVIAVSHACADSISRFVTGDRLHIVYNGIPLSKERDAKVDARKYVLDKMGLPGGSRLILSAGHICSRKGQVYAVEIFLKIIQNVPSAVLLLAGRLDVDSEYVGRLREKIRELNLQDKVQLLGYREDIDLFMQGSDLFLHTPVKDPHPRVVIEAMNFELPVVAFAVDGVAETVVDGETGYLIRSGDIDGMAQASTRLLFDPELRKQMGTKARQRVQTHFSAERTAEQVGQVINLVLARQSLNSGKI